jgi:lambda family phage portal protein
MGILGRTREYFHQFNQFRRGEMPPNARFSDHFSREIGKLKERYFPAADLSAVRQDWNPTVLVDQNILRLEYRRLFARAKRAFDTDPYARSCVNVLQSQIIGNGITPRHKPVDESGKEIPGLGKLLDTHWERFSEECLRPNHDSFIDLERKFIANCCISGGLFLNFVPAPKGNLLPFGFQLIDQSYIEFSHDNFAMPSAQMIYNGVQINDFGEPQEYYFQDLVTWMFFNMPANNMIHCYEKWHCNQFIGIPWLAPVLTTLWDLSQLQEDRLISSRIQAAIALWIPEDNKYPGSKNKTANDKVSWAPASIMKGPAGHKPEVIQASDSIRDTLQALIELYLYQVSSGMGISYQEMCADTQGSSFSASRTVTTDRRRHYKTKQQFCVRALCQPANKKFVQWAFLCGLIPGKSIVDFRQNPWGFCHTKWTPDKWDFVDPLKDMNAMIAERDAGWLTDEKQCELIGDDRDERYATLAEEKKLKTALDIMPPEIVKEASASKFPQEENNASNEK